MTDNTSNVISDESSNLSESERLAAEIQNMIFSAVSTPEKEENVAPTVEESVILPENAPEPLVEAAPSPEEEAAEEKALDQEDAVEPIEVEEEPSQDFDEEPEVEVVQEVEQVPATVFVKTETPEEDIVKAPAVSRKLPSAAIELLNNIDGELSQIIVVAPSEKEDSSKVAFLVAMGLSSSKKALLVNCKPSDTMNECPTDMENLSFMSAGEDISFDRSGFDTVVYAMGNVVNTEALTADCGVLFAVKPKVTTYGAYRRALKILKGSPAKIIGAVIV